MSDFKKRLIYLWTFCSLLFFACQSNVKHASRIDRPDQAMKSDSLILLMPIDSLDIVYDKLLKSKLVRNFYSLRDYQLAWIKNHKLSLLGDSMVWIINNVHYYGLPPTKYHLAEIEIGRFDSSMDLTRQDVLLTDAFFTIAADLKFGRLNVGSNDKYDSLCVSLLQEVLNCLGLKKSLELQEPNFSSYKYLKEALRLIIDSLGGEYKNTPMVSVHKTIQTIEINLDRWRSESIPYGDNYVLVNIPSFMLQVVSDREVVIESRIIVGKPNTPTPLLSSTIECFIIYPYWHVPRKIAVEEYLPVIQQDISFLARGNFEVLNSKGILLNPDSVDWKGFSKNNFPVILRQREGPDNSLGVIKFIFDNPYAVYLHDTNAKRLFNWNIRAFSHGCIRMEKAILLAHYLITGDINVESKVIANYLRRKQRHVVDLRKPIPVYVRYFTCESKDGVFYQYDDLYSMDKVLMDIGYP